MGGKGGTGRGTEQWDREQRNSQRDVIKLETTVVQSCPTGSVRAGLSLRST